jgi:hypothetical protein
LQDVQDEEFKRAVQGGFNVHQEESRAARKGIDTIPVLKGGLSE